MHETNGRIDNCKSFRWTVVSLPRPQSLWEEGRADDMLSNGRYHGRYHEYLIYTR